MWPWSEKTPRRSGGPDFLGNWSRLMRVSWRRVLWGCLGCCVPAEIRLEGSDSGVRQVLLRGSWESVLSWHTWFPGCGVHPLGGCLCAGVLRGLAWPGLGAWWRARGGWCEVLVLRTGGGEQHRALGRPCAGALLRPVPVG